MTNAIGNLWILGTLGMICMEASYLPQIFRLYRIKRAEDVSTFFPALNVGGRTMAMTFALLSNQTVFSIGLMFGILIRLTFFGQVLWYRHAKQVVHERLSLRPAPLPVSSYGDRRP